MWYFIPLKKRMLHNCYLSVFNLNTFMIYIHCLSSDAQTATHNLADQAQADQDSVPSDEDTVNSEVSTEVAECEEG